MVDPAPGEPRGLVAGGRGLGLTSVRRGGVQTFVIGEPVPEAQRGRGNLLGAPGG